MKTAEEKQRIRIIPDNYSSGIVILGKSYSALVLVECLAVMAIVAFFSIVMFAGLLKTQPGLAVGIIGSLVIIAGKLTLDGVYDEDLIHFLINIILFKKKKRKIVFGDNTTEIKPVSNIFLIKEKAISLLNWNKQKEKGKNNGVEQKNGEIPISPADY